MRLNFAHVKDLYSCGIKIGIKHSRKSSMNVLSGQYIAVSGLQTDNHDIFTYKCITIPHFNKYCHSASHRCWQCGVEIEKLKNLFCSQCHAIQRAGEVSNYFKVLNMQESYDIDNNLLSQSYRKLQSLLHPDKYTNKNLEEKNISEFRSALVNQAYNSLRNPLKRGLHLLKLNGKSIEIDEVKDTKFLAEVMDKYEELENESDLMELKRMFDDSSKNIEELSKNISLAFNQKNFDEAKILLSKMKYYDSIHNQLKDKIQSMEIVR